MKTTLIIILIFFLSIIFFSVSFSQSYPDDQYTDVVLLKNGGAFLGVKVVRIVKKKKVIIENMDGVEIDIPFRKIYAITDEENYPTIREEFEVNRPPKPGSLLKDPEHFVMLGVASGGGATAISALVINGYYFSNFFVGVGMGWEGRPDDGFVSLLIDARVYSNVGKIKNYLYTEIGFFGGSRVGLGVGLKIPWNDPLSILIQAGYRRQGVPDGGSYNAVAFLIGITFKT